MLAPADRRLLLDVLAPPEGYTLDHGVGTTYTLDLLALLRVPLAATALPGPVRRRPVDNPFALLTALRRNASRISLFCHAGATKVPGQSHPAARVPRELGASRHATNTRRRLSPQVLAAALRARVRRTIRSDTGSLVLSRNLTFDRSWDVALHSTASSSGASGATAPTAHWPISSPRFRRWRRPPATSFPPLQRERVELLTSEVRRVEWSPPEAFDDVTFHPIGHDGKPSWPVSTFIGSWSSRRSSVPRRSSG